MEKKEKVEFILEQMRLCIAVKDYIRTQIISKKINTKFFQEEGSEVRDAISFSFHGNTSEAVLHLPHFCPFAFLGAEVEVL